MLDDRAIVTRGPHSEHARSFPALPEYAVRVSARARRVRLTVSARDGLVVVVPAGWRVDAAAVVREKRAWAVRALEAVAERRAVLLAGPEALLPSRIELTAIGALLTVDYREKPSRSTGPVVTARVEGCVLMVEGAIEDAEASLAALRRWLDREARSRLPALLAAESARTGLHPVRVRITSAKTRWGSCSARKTISLNRNLLFLPPELARALVLHELAHLRVLDHSARFWATLAELDPDALEHRAELKAGGEFVPAWAEH